VKRVGFHPPVERAVPILAQLYDLHAEECARAAEQTDNPKRREMLIKLAMQWRQEAQTLRQSPQPNHSEDDGKAATRGTKSAPNTTKQSRKANTSPGHEKTRAPRAERAR
jgi:hypothetical protein